MKFEFVKHDIEKEVPVRDASGMCVLCERGETGELLGLIDNSDPSKKFRGYTDEEATAKKIIRDVKVKGDMYFRTGDLLRWDADGYIYFVDRIGDTFRWKGENVSTNEVSEVVSVFPGILEANCYGVKVPNAQDGRACMAAITTKGHIDLAAFAKHVTSELASYAIPQFLRALPKMESTGTFKQRKVNFVKDGFDPSVVKDPLWWFNPKTKTYEELDAPKYHKLFIAGGARM